MTKLFHSLLTAPSLTASHSLLTLLTIH